MHRTLNWVLALATLAGMSALYVIKEGTRRLEARVQAQERALERAENDVSVLTAERAHLARPERLEPLARKLGMVPVGASQYMRIEVDARAPSPLVGEGQGGADRGPSASAVPPTPSPSPQGGGEPTRPSGQAAPSRTAR